MKTGREFGTKKRLAAMEMIGNHPYENLFESIEGDDFESR